MALEDELNSINDDNPKPVSLTTPEIFNPALFAPNNTHLSNLCSRKQSMVKAYFENKMNVTVACRMCNVSRKTFYLWMENDSEFAETIGDYKTMLNDYAIQSMLENLMMKDPRMTMFVLSKLNPAFKDQLDITSNGKTIQAATINIIAPQPPPSQQDV